METPICVTDARTLVDHIYEIKSWLYNGQLRLIVPSTLPENVEMLHPNNKEPKNSLKEPPRPKNTLGKPARREYPSFDANRMVAKEFLGRLEAGKNFEPVHEGRPIFSAEENHGAVHFPAPKEQYSAWKDVEDYEERTESPTGVESWAEKLKRKQIIANGNLEEKPKGPVKPKLVARTTVDNQPWKVQKNAPTISGLDVPNPLRPMMNCCLWRIHESVHRNDENQVFVLTDQAHVKNIAQKLNITIRSTREVGQLIEKARPAVDLNSSGDLEKLFGARPVKARSVKKCTAVKGSPLPKVQTSQRPEGLPEDVTKSNVGSEVAKPEFTAPISKLKSGSNTPHVARESDSANAIKSFITAGTSDSLQENANASVVEDSARKKPAAAKDLSTSSQHQAQGLSALSPALTAGSVEERVNGSAAKSLPTPALESTISSEASNMSRSFAAALSGNEARKASPTPSQQVPPAAASKPEVAEPAPPTPTAPRVSPWAQIQKPVAVSLSNPSPPPAAQTKASPSVISKREMEVKPLPSKVEAVPRPRTPLKLSDSPDSDEEVVFQPKRLSAQRKPMQQNSRPTTPNVAGSTDLQMTPVSQGPQAIGTNRQVTPKHKHSQRPASGTGIARPGSATTQTVVIDPNAFGRDFAVNTNQNSKGSVRGPRPRHSPQPSLFEAGTTTQAGSASAHRQQHQSPDRPSPKQSPKQNVRTPAQTRKHVNAPPPRQTPPASVQRPANTSEPKQLPIGSGRPQGLPARESPLQPETPVASGQGAPSMFSPPTLNANAPIFQPGTISNAFLSSPSQPENAAPKSTPPTQPPIGSGRPSSKASQQKMVEPFESPLAKLGGEPEIRGEVQASTPPTTDSHPPPIGPRHQKEAHFATRGNPHHHPGTRGVRPQHGLTRANLDKHNNASPTAHNGNKTQPPNGDLHGHSAPAIRGRGGSPHVRTAAATAAARAAKPSLFEPDLDHTRAYQPEGIEAKKPAVRDVQYVLKSGSTREQARGKGKLWVG